MFEVRYGIKLKQDTTDTRVLKLLRKHFPSQSFSWFQTRIKDHDYIFLSDVEDPDVMSKMIRLLVELDRIGIETELFEEKRYTPNLWKSEHITREYFENILQRNYEIQKEILENTERETMGYISPEAKRNIELEILETKKKDKWD